MKTYTFELCEGRHYSPAKEGIYPKTITENGYDTAMLERRADERIPLDCERLELYTSGFVKAVLAVVKVCARRGFILLRITTARGIKYMSRRISSDTGEGAEYVSLSFFAFRTSLLIE